MRSDSGSSSGIEDKSDSPLDELLTLIDDFHAYNPTGIPILPYPTSLEFCKKVNKGFPCVYQAYDILSHENKEPPNGINNTGSRPRPPSCPALNWTKIDLKSKLTEPVEVAVTPDGRADALCPLPEPQSHLDPAADSPSSDPQQVFLQPAIINTSISDLLSKLQQSSSLKLSTKQVSPIYYLQSQNSNLTTTSLSPLLEDLPASFPFADETLENVPEATNIWIGDAHSVTSAHRDPYENLYLVLKGSKTFTLWAPVDEIAMCATMVRTGRYAYNHAADDGEERFEIVLDDDDDEQRIPWIPIDPDAKLDETLASYPLYAHAKPFRVTVCEGQILYLPAGWYHHVRQACGRWADGSVSPCIAVNYWYDMDYEGEKYSMRQLMTRLVERVRDEMQKEQSK